MRVLPRIMTGQGGVAVALVAFLLAVIQPQVTAQAQATSSPEGFISKLRDDAVEQLTDGSLPQEERKARFKALLSEGFDMPAIGRFVTARYWRQAEEQAKHDFIDVFQDVITLRFLPIFDQYEDGTELKVERVIRDKDNPRVIDVYSSLTRPAKEPVAIAWRLLENEGSYKIVDVRVENLSMAITLRSEYTSLLQRKNGDMSALVADLRERVAAGDVGDAKITDSQ